MREEIVDTAVQERATLLRADEYSQAASEMVCIAFRMTDVQVRATVLQQAAELTLCANRWREGQR